MYGARPNKPPIRDILAVVSVMERTRGGAIAYTVSDVAVLSGLPSARVRTILAKLWFEDLVCVANHPFKRRKLWWLL